MEQNVGVLDQVIRIGIGFGLFGLAFMLAPPLNYWAYTGFLVFAITGFSGKCWLYRLLGLSSAKKAPA